MAGGEAVIGIDLGTTYSCVAVARDGTIEIITNDQGNRTTPSIVAFAGDERLIGEAAKNQATLNPTRTFFDVKRLIGKKFDDPEVQKDINYLPYPVVNRDGKPYVEVKDQDDGVFSAEEISAMVLGKMKETAEAYLGKTVTRAVITVPAYFNDAQRQATKDAGRIAGLEVERIINEPTAGAIAYEWRRDWEDKRKILVYDLGGGTFDVSILEIEHDEFKVLATKDVGGDRKAIAKLRKECERAKRALSGQLTQVSVIIDCFLDGMDFSEVLTRARFEELNLELFKKTLEVVKSVMEDAKVGKGDVDEIVLVGGSTRIPRLREMLKEMFDGKEPCRGVNPDEAVAYDVTLCDVTPLSLGVELLGGLMLVIIPRNTPIPTKMSGNFETVADWQTSVTTKVYQGERPLTKDCIEIGNFLMSGLTPAPRGVTKTEKIFEIDENGILTVTAWETGCFAATAASLTITSYKGDLTKTEIERMIKKAKKMAEKDEIAKARVDARNRLERFIYDAKNGDNKMERELEEASRWLDGNQDASKEDYEKKMKELKHICY
ncbi:Heat shock 70 kDa protein BIP2 [Linum grandiflorum]